MNSIVIRAKQKVNCQELMINYIRISVWLGYCLKASYSKRDQLNTHGFYTVKISMALKLLSVRDLNKDNSTKKLNF